MFLRTEVVLLKPLLDFCQQNVSRCLQDGELFTRRRQFHATLHRTVLFKFKFSLHILTLLFKVAYLVDECFTFSTNKLCKAITRCLSVFHRHNEPSKEGSFLDQFCSKPEACDDFHWHHHKADKLNYEYKSFLELTSPELRRNFAVHDCSVKLSRTR